LDEIEPSERALELADDKDPRHVEAILMESAQIVRVRPPLIITETRHGFICASAGVDASNAKGKDTLILLPLDPDASAASIRAGVRERGVGHDIVIPAGRDLFR
jgi:coenzyme F420-0:L-glutamate ligase/coenzyme F420-1:gamma-L-glutamate ligase